MGYVHSPVWGIEHQEPCEHGSTYTQIVLCLSLVTRWDVVFAPKLMSRAPWKLCKGLRLVGSYLVRHCRGLPSLTEAWPWLTNFFGKLPSLNNIGNSGGNLAEQSKTTDVGTKSTGHDFDDLRRNELTDYVYCDLSERWKVIGRHGVDRRGWVITWGSMASLIF